MALIDRLGKLEQELPTQRWFEFEARCIELAEEIRKEAVSHVENAIKSGTYMITTTGFFRNKKTVKSVSGKTYEIVVYNDSPIWDGSPRFCYSDGSDWYGVRSVKELSFFCAAIKRVLESEGFKVWLDDAKHHSTGACVYYSIEWQ